MNDETRDDREAARHHAESLIKGTTRRDVLVYGCDLCAWLVANGFGLIDQKPEVPAERAE